MRPPEECQRLNQRVTHLGDENVVLRSRAGNPDRKGCNWHLGEL